MSARWILILAALWATPAVAGTTSITISQRARLEAGQFVVTLALGNEGDEAALGVTPTLRFRGREVRGKAAERLYPTDTVEERLVLPAEGLGEGRWPYEIAVDYTDGNLYAFQALQVQTLVVGSPPPAKVVVPAFAGASVAGTGAIEVRVKNLTPEPRTARIQARMPAGVEVGEATREQRLDAWQELSFELPLTNRTGLVGSVYPLFVVAEYDDGPVHQAVVAQSSVSITSAGSFIDRNGRAMTIASAVLIALWIGTLLPSALRRAPAAPGA
jgi:hypothetical protein